MTDQPYTESPHLADGPADEAAAEVHGSAEQAGSAAGHIADQASRIADQAKREYFEPAKEYARDALEQQKQAGADRIGGFARAAHRAADGLGDDMPLAAEYVREAAGGIEQISNTLRARSIDELVEDLGKFARNQPVAFFGATIAAGFALSRFLKSTAAPRPGPAVTGQKDAGVRG